MKKIMFALMTLSCLKAADYANPQEVVVALKSKPAVELTAHCARAITYMPTPIDVSTDGDSLRFSYAYNEDDHSGNGSYYFSVPESIAIIQFCSSPAQNSPINSAFTFTQQAAKLLMDYNVE